MDANVQQHKVQAEKITKPIQLLAAWLVGLFILNASFLTAAISIGPGWERGALVAACILNVPGFIAALFVLQTKFRPELQEDTFYSQYLSRKSNSIVEVNKLDMIEQSLTDIKTKFHNITAKEIGFEASNGTDSIDWSDWKVAINRHLPYHNQLRAELLEAGVPVTASFGANKGKMPLPENVIISFSESMPTPLVLTILNIAVRYPVYGFDFWEPYRDAGEAEDVYIGAYGDHSEAVVLNEEAQRKLPMVSKRIELLNLNVSE